MGRHGSGSLRPRTTSRLRHHRLPDGAAGNTLCIEAWSGRSSIRFPCVQFSASEPLPKSWARRGILQDQQSTTDCPPVLGSICHPAMTGFKTRCSNTPRSLCSRPYPVEQQLQNHPSNNALQVALAEVSWGRTDALFFKHRAKSANQEAGARGVYRADLF